jgi:hypothetical protein
MNNKSFKISKNWEVLSTDLQNGGDFQNGRKFSFSTITQYIFNFFAFCFNDLSLYFSRTYFTEEKFFCQVQDGV